MKNDEEDTGGMTGALAALNALLETPQPWDNARIVAGLTAIGTVINVLSCKIDFVLGFTDGFSERQISWEKQLRERFAALEGRVTYLEGGRNETWRKD